MEFEDWIQNQNPKDKPTIRKKVEVVSFKIYKERFNPNSTPEQQITDIRSAQEIVMMDIDGIFYGYKHKT